MFDNFPTGDSIVYKLLLLEREEIARLKWIESEKAGRDIGDAHAFWIWNLGHRKAWLEEAKKKLR